MGGDEAATWANGRLDLFRGTGGLERRTPAASRRELIASQPKQQGATKRSVSKGRARGPMARAYGWVECDGEMFHKPGRGAQLRRIASTVHGGCRTAAKAAGLSAAVLREIMAIQNARDSEGPFSGVQRTAVRLYYISRSKLPTRPVLSVSGRASWKFGPGKV